ncbi:MAG TPA: ABC transporter ATP-binding protein [Trueperaceae bacterium]
MTVGSLRLPVGNAEFTIEDAHRYDRRSPVRWILSHVARYKLLATGFLLGIIVTQALFAAVPRLTGVAFDLVLQPEPEGGKLFTIMLLLLGILAVRVVFDLTAFFSIETMGQRLERDAREELFVSLLGKSQTFHNRQRVGDVMARVANDVRMLNGMMNPGVALIGDTVFGMLLPLVYIGLLDWRLLSAPLAFIVAFVFALRHYMARLNPVAGNMRRQFGVMNAGLNETISGIELVKSAAQEEREKGKFTTSAAAYRDYFVRQGEVQARYLPLLLFGVMFAGAFAHGLWLLSHGALSVGELVAYVGLVSALRGLADLSIFSFSLVQLGLAGAERILELMKEETELDENPAGHRAEVQGEIVFDQVSFRYEDSDAREALKGVSFTASPGETIAIVGQTGSGKSTLVKLVNRGYDASEGRVLIDGVDVRDWHLESLRQQISVIEQDIFLFSRTVADNIAFGLAGATREQVVAAAKAAQAHEFIMGFSDGYDTVIGERGVTLSGGQRQRLAIARALLTDPRILILDDSTSAIDSATEDAIQKAINKVLEGRTTLMITHRLSQIRKADKILLLERGELVDQGGHYELLERNDHYRRIFSRYD